MANSDMFMEADAKQMAEHVGVTVHLKVRRIRESMIRAWLIGLFLNLARSVSWFKCIDEVSLLSDLDDISHTGLSEWSIVYNNDGVYHIVINRDGSSYNHSTHSINDAIRELVSHLEMISN